jgi:colanic acid/amylovoran biosynthesis glycosyltransferase
LGIDVEKLRFEERKVNRQSIRFLVASSFLKKKGVELAVQALSKFKDRYDFSMDIIGDGPLKNEILMEIDRGGIKDRVKLHGYQSYDYLINLMYQCDVFIQASRTTEDNRKEGTPMAIVDAMATGMAVVSTRHSDIPEIVLDESTGYIAEENDLGSLQLCIQKLFDNPQKIPAFSRKGREHVEKEFNAKTQLSKLEELYLELINSKA